MPTSQKITVPLESILLDLNNPRTDPTHSQPEALEQLFKSQRGRIVKLAKHILEHGLNPTDQPIVTQQGRFYVVHDGNRRIAALMCLHEPTRSPQLFRKQFEKLSQSDTLPSEVECALFDSFEDTREWIRLRHSSGHPGSTNPWSPQQKARFDKKPDRTHQLMEWYCDHGDPELIQRYKKSSIFTTLQRLLDNPEARSRIGVAMDATKLVRTVTDQSLLRGVSKIVDDFTHPDSHRRKKVGDIYKTAQCRAYLDSIQEELPSPMQQIASPMPLGSEDPPGLPPAPALDPKHVSSLMAERKTLVQKGARFNTGKERLDGIFTELRRLPYRKFPNACAVLLRCLLDMSAPYYCRRHGMTAGEGLGSFTPNWKRATEHMLAHGKITNPELLAMNHCVNDEEGALTIKRLHQWVHNAEALVMFNDLRQIWAIMWPFLKVVGATRAK